MLYFVLKYLHVIGAAVLLGTGAGIAFFMLLAHRTGNAATIAAVARIVVIADFLFTTTAVIAQPITGVALASIAGHSLSEGWIVLSILLYILTGLFWLPVVWIQTENAKSCIASRRNWAISSRTLSQAVPPLVRARLPCLRGRACHLLAHDHPPLHSVVRRPRLRGDRGPSVAILRHEPNELITPLR